jgi:hypothetical protein
MMVTVLTRSTCNTEFNHPRNHVILKSNAILYISVLYTTEMITCNYFVSVRNGIIEEGGHTLFIFFFRAIGKQNCNSAGVRVSSDSFYISILEGMVDDCVGR